MAGARAGSIGAIRQIDQQIQQQTIKTNVILIIGMRIIGAASFLLLALGVPAQKLERDFPVTAAPVISVINPYGRVSISADEKVVDRVIVIANSAAGPPVAAEDITFTSAGNNLNIVVN